MPFHIYISVGGWKNMSLRLYVQLSYLVTDEFMEQVSFRISP